MTGEPKYTTVHECQAPEVAESPEWEAVRKGAGRQLILAPGCSVPNETTDEELLRLSELLTV